MLIARLSTERVEAARALERRVDYQCLLRNHYSRKGYDIQLEYELLRRRSDVLIPELHTAFEVEFSAKEEKEFVAKCRIIGGDRSDLSGY